MEIINSEKKKVTPYDIAKTQIGISESISPMKIEEYHKAAGIVADIRTSWCASFISYCFEKSDYADIGIKNPWARAWSKVGIAIEDPSEGDLVVLTRGENQGHVGFFVKYSEKPGFLSILSGNQDNMVKYKDYELSRVISFRKYL